MKSIGGVSAKIQDMFDDMDGGEVFTALAIFSANWKIGVSNASLEKYLHIPLWNLANQVHVDIVYEIDVYLPNNDGK